MSRLKFVINGNLIIYDELDTYKSTIQDITDELIKINIPIGKAGMYSYEFNKEVEFNYYDSNCYYVFKGHIIGREKDKDTNIPLYIIKYDVNTIKKIERREFVRVDCIEYIYYKKNYLEEQSNWKKALLLNLSGGGFKFSTDEALNKEYLLEFKFVIEDKIYIINARIVRKIKKNNESNVYAAEFINITEKVREKIIQKVFKQMRKERNYI